MARESEFLTIAHRGASGYRPENTMSSFRYAWKLGITYIECDLQYTKDHRIVIFHDSLVDRTTDSSGKLNDFMFDELVSLDAGSWFGSEFSKVRVPSLEELFSETPMGTHLTLELKDTDTTQFVDEVVEYVKRYKFSKRVHLSSFNFNHLARVHKIAPGLITAALFRWDETESNRESMPREQEFMYCSSSKSFDFLIKNLRTEGVSIACPPASAVSPGVVEALHNEGFLVRAWGLSKHCDVHEMQALIRCGVDGMTSNFPDVLHDVYLRYKNRQ